MRSTEHLFASYHADTPGYVSRMCLYAGFFTTPQTTEEDPTANPTPPCRRTKRHKNATSTRRPR